MSIAPKQAFAVSELSLGELLSVALVEPDQISDDDAMGWTGLYLTSLIAERAEVEHSEVWHVLTHLPGNYLDMLQSPEGWDALAALVCGVLGVAFAPVLPSRH